jgi:hypothetical protein
MDPTSRSLFLSGEAKGVPAVPGPPIGDHFYQAKYHRTGSGPGSHVYDHPFFDSGLDIGEVIPHEKVYNIPCNTQWVCPAGVTNVCVLGVGGGGGGTGYGPGGGGAGLFYRNNVSVTPGTSYTIEVGFGGWPGNTQKAAQDGYSTRVDMPNYSIAKGGNGGPQVPGYSGGTGGTGGSYLGTTSGGGNGGNGGNSVAKGSGWNSAGGGGAAGYSGNGGNGGNSTQTSASSGSSGSGGGGGGGAGSVDLTGQGYGFGGEGGGVGLFGEGSSGAGGSNTNSVGNMDPKPGIGGDGGSGGTDGGDRFAWDVPGTHGGGGAGDYMPGGHGAVRIVYSVTGRTNPSFPNNAGKFSSSTVKYLWWYMTDGAFGPRWYTNGAVNETYPWTGFGPNQTQTVGRYNSLHIINGMLGAQRDPNQYSYASSYTNRHAYAQAFKPGTGFVDIVSWDGNAGGASSRTISHSLGSTPGFIRILQDSGSSKSVCLHDDGTTQRRCDWSSSLGTASDGIISATSNADFTVSTTSDPKNVNKNGIRYTAAVFASNDTVRCGSWVGTSGSQNIDLGMPNGCQAIWIYDMGNTTWYHISTKYDGYSGNSLGSSSQEKYATFSASTLSSASIMSSYSGGFQLIHNSLFNTSGTRYLYVAFSA